MKATEVTAGLAESNGGLLPGQWRDSLHVTCVLTACTLGSAPGPTLGNEYGKTLPLPRLIRKGKRLGVSAVAITDATIQLRCPSQLIIGDKYAPAAPNAGPARRDRRHFGPVRSHPALRQLLRDRTFRHTANGQIKRRGDEMPA